MKILIVEDEKNIVLSLRMLLSKLGYEVLCVDNGVEALEISRSFKPDLVLLDIILPGIDGYLVCQAMREEQETAKIPIVFISAMSREEDLKRAYQAGASDYLIKPFTPEKIKKTLEKYLKGGLSDEKNSDCR